MVGNDSIFALEYLLKCIYIFSWLDSPRPPDYREFTMTLRHTTLSSTHLDEKSVRCREIYMTTHNTDKISMPPAGFEPTFPASERPRTYALVIPIYIVYSVLKNTFF